jgi:hypothetical protein
MIRVFIGTAAKWAKHEPVLEHSIRANTDAEVEVEFLRAGEHGLKPSGCTGFTNFRYAIPEIAGREGFAIYLDIDMIVLADIAELWDYRERGQWVCLADGSTEVSVIDCTLQFPPIRMLPQFKKYHLVNMAPVRRSIPLEWNVKDRVEPGMKLLHFTDLRQNWIAGEHSCREAMEVLHDYRKSETRDRSGQGIA